MQHLFVEQCVDFVDYLVRHEAVEHARRDRENIRGVAAGALEVEAGEFHALVDVHVREELDLCMLGEMQRGLTRPALVVGQRENGVLHTAP